MWTVKQTPSEVCLQPKEVAHKRFFEVQTGGRSLNRIERRRAVTPKNFKILDKRRFRQKNTKKAQWDGIIQVMFTSLPHRRCCNLLKDEIKKIRPTSKTCRNTFIRAACCHISKTSIVSVWIDVWLVLDFHRGGQQIVYTFSNKSVGT